MRAEKSSMVNELAGLIDGRSAVLFSYQGLTANVFNSFRAKVAGEGINGSCHVVPNKLLKKAAGQVGLDALANVELSGDTAMASGVDAVSLVRAVKDFAAGEGKDKVKIDLMPVKSYQEIYQENQAKNPGYFKKSFSDGKDMSRIVDFYRLNK